MNAMKRFYAYIVLASLCLTSAWAQQIPVFNQYLYNPFLYNPARAGGEELGNVFLGQRKQWSDIPNAPDTRILTFDMPLPFDDKSGVGISLFNDQTHIISKVGASLTYAYHIRFDDEQKLSFGVSGGFLNQRIDFSSASIQDPNDPAILSRDANSTTFDVGFGMHYRFRNLDIDVSVPQLSNSNVRFLSNASEISTFQLVSHYLGTARYRIPIGQPKTRNGQALHEVTVEPVLTIRGARGLPVQYDANLLLNWYKQFWIGAGYRSGSTGTFASAANVSFGFKVAETLIASYTYEFSPDSKNRFSFGNTHEFALGFRFGKTPRKVTDLERKVGTLEATQMEILNDSTRFAAQDTADAEPEIDPELLEMMELMKQLEQLEKLKQLEDLQRLEQLKKLEELRKLQELQMLKDLEKSNHTEAEKEVIERGLKTNPADLKFEKIGSVFFKVNSSELSDEARSDLRSVKNRLTVKGELFTIYIAGNASIEGESVYNLVLSNRRAITVKNYLASIGMDDSIVLPIPYGAENPITKEQQFEADREKNRRVDIFILAKSALEQQEDKK